LPTRCDRSFLSIIRIMREGRGEGLVKKKPTLGSVIIEKNIPLIRPRVLLMQPSFFDRNAICRDPNRHGLRAFVVMADAALSHVSHTVPIWFSLFHFVISISTTRYNARKT
jgi:hypothetical protein